jgi:endonuclease YncB( thermonuclease family)
VRLGLAKTIVEKGSKYYECFQKAEEEAKKNKTKIWSSS